jgi:hypothetical protein
MAFSAFLELPGMDRILTQLTCSYDTVKIFMGLPTTGGPTPEQKA